MLSLPAAHSLSSMQGEDPIRAIINAMPIQAWYAGPDGSAEYHNVEWLEHTGMRAEAARGWGWLEAIHPDDRDSLAGTWKEIRQSRQAGVMEVRVLGPDEEHRWSVMRAVPVHDAEGNVTRWYVAHTDIEDRKLAEALLAGKNHALELLARGDSLTDVLTAICLVVEQASPRSLASILLLDGASGRLKRGAAPHLPGTFIDAIEDLHRRGEPGPCALAVTLRQPQIFGDLGDAEVSEAYRQTAREHDLEACWSTPICASSGEILGTFAIYARKPSLPTEREQTIIQQMTHLAAVALEHFRTQTRLEALSAEFELAINTIPGHVWTALPDGSIDFLNQRWREYTGLRLEEATGWGWRVAIHPEDLAGLGSYWQDVLASGAPGETEARLRRHDGAYRWFFFRAVPLHGEDGSVVKWYGQTTDIHDRKMAEVALRESEASLAKAQRLSATGSFAYRAETGEVICSEETRRICGLPGTEPPSGETLRDLIHPDDLPLFRGMLGGTGTDFNFECRLKLDAGTIKHLNVVATASRNEAGQITEWSGAVMDVTAHKQAAEALRASEHLARGQLEALTGTLEALSQESAPERFLEQVLRVMGGQLGAHSLCAWEISRDSTGIITPMAGYEEGRLHLFSRTETRDLLQVPVEPGDHPVWGGFFKGGDYSVVGEIHDGTPQVRRADDLDEPPHWHDCTGHPMVPDQLQQLTADGILVMLWVPMFVAGKVTGLLSIRFKEKRRFRSEDIRLSQALAHQAMLAIQLIRLSQESRQSAVMTERNRLAREIHDTLAQGFTGVIIQLEAAADAGSKGLVQESEQHLRRAGDLARESLKEARRSVQALRPGALQSHGLCKALEELFQQMCAGTSLSATFQARGGPGALPPEWEDNLLRICQEVLTNALRHAEATAFHTVLDFGEEGTRLELRDDGRGFHPTARHDGFGLRGIAERVAEMGGVLHLESAPGDGTRVLITLPREPGAASSPA